MNRRLKNLEFRVSLLFEIERGMFREAEFHEL